MMGSVYGLFTGAASGNLRHIIRLTTWGSLALTGGFMLNRLSAALIQSYLVQSPTQDFIQTGWTGILAYLIVPYLLEGMLLGILTCGIAKRKFALKA